jgi:membrane fusion protein (multidrug efflux system)
MTNLRLFQRPAPRLALLLAAIALLPLACQKPPAEAKKPAPTATVAVTVAKVETVVADRSIPIVGTLFPKDEATICAEVEGRVEKTTVEFGDRLTTGQELGQIDTASYAAFAHKAEAEVARAKATAANAEQNLRRVQELKKNNIASSSDLDKATAEADQARAEIKAAEAALVLAELNVAHSRVQAPFDSAIAERLVGAGDFVKVGTPLFHIVNDKLIKFITSVPERFAGEVKKGQLAVFNVDAYPGRAFEGKVLLISPSVTARTRAFSFGVLVHNEELTLKANSFARGELIVEHAVPVLVVPIDAVQNFSGINKVYVVENDLAMVREVQAGKIKDGRQQILSGLKAGEVVVISGQSKLRDGTKISVRPPPEPSSPAPVPAKAGKD